MNVKLHKIGICMSKLAIYAMIVCQSLIMAMASGSEAQRKLLDEIPIFIENTSEYRSLTDVISEIESKGEFTFAYSKRDVKEKVIRLDEQNWTMESLLKEISVQGRFAIRRVNETITLNPVGGQELPDVDEKVTLQNSISGKVTDENGEPLPGTTVLEKGTTNGTITDVDGAFNLSAAEDAVLLISFVGYQSQEVSVAGRSEITVQMTLDAEQLEEVVVVGYGVVKKSDLTGTVASISTEETKDIPNTNVLQALQGRVPGLNITTPDRPGESPGVIIRGTNSLNASNTPLIVVDGIIYNGSLNDFNVNDIEKIDILRDASAAAVFGSRSANGVIIITTKTGTASKPTFNFNTYHGVSSPVKLIPLLDGPGYIQKVLDYRESVGLEADPNNIEDYLLPTEAENYRNGQTIDWYDEIIKNGKTSHYSLNVSGKSDLTDYYLSGSYLKQDGIVENDNFERINLKANFTNHITDWYSVSVRTAFSRSDYSGVAARLVYGLSPYGSFWENEATRTLREFPTEDFFFSNPLFNTFIDNEEVGTSLFGIVSSELKVPFIDGLKWTLNYSPNLLTRKESNFWSNKLQAGRTTNGRGEKEITEEFNQTLDNIISYNRVFGGIHSVDLTFLYSRQYARYERTFAAASDFFNHATGYNNLGLGAVQQSDSDLQDQNNVAYMARLNYVFDNKYMITATVRKDGFSGFSQGNKYATFPSIALAWTLSNESFMDNLSWLNTLKLRLSYGVNGNQALGRYRTLARIGSGQYVFGDGGSTISTVHISSMANNNLGWETTRVKNIGLDFSMVKSRLSGSIDVYSSNTSNILMNRNIPSTTGFSSVWTNIGKVHNHGFEVMLNSVNIERNDFSWESGFTFALNRNRIEELLGEDLDGDGIEDDNIANSWFIGEPLGVIYGYKVDGIYQLEDADIPTGFKPGDFRVVDVTGDGSITPEDRTILGSRLPNYTFSISNTLHYKNFSFYVLVNSIQGGGDNYYVGNNIEMHNVNNTFSTWTERFNVHDVPYWTPQNPSNEYASIHYVPTFPHPYLEDRSFVRLQDITVSYSFDKSPLEKIGVLGLRLYLSGKYLYTWTKWTGYDPENQTTIGDFPMLRTFTMGADLKF